MATGEESKGFFSGLGRAVSAVAKSADPQKLGQLGRVPSRFKAAVRGRQAFPGLAEKKPWVLRGSVIRSLKAQARPLGKGGTFSHAVAKIVPKVASAAFKASNQQTLGRVPSRRNEGGNFKGRTGGGGGQRGRSAFGQEAGGVTRGIRSITTRIRGRGNPALKRFKPFGA